jgi:hypothetical protein
MPVNRPYLNPMPGLGSYGRTAAAILVGGSRSSIASQGRIYAFEKSKGREQAYIAYLINSLGPIPRQRNAWSLM